MIRNLTDIKVLSNKDLLNEYEALHDSIFITECFGANDVRVHLALSRELDSRGITSDVDQEL